MHAETSPSFTQIVDMNRMETYMHNTYMGLYGNITP